MADKKISQLSGASTPLAGTEVLPIVQGGSTVKVSVDNLTTGKNVPATSFNKVTITAPATSATLTIADGKTLTANNSIAISGTDSTTMTFPSTSATIARTDAAQNFAGNNTFDTDVLGIDASNNRVGVGTASPSQLFHVKGASGAISLLENDVSNAATQFRVKNSTSTMYVALDSSTGGSFGNANAGVVWLDSNNKLIFGTNNANQMELTAASGLKLINQGLVIGTAGKGIDFSANTHAAGMSSELLNWYEAGTWTPTYVPETGAFSAITYGFNTGQYVRIGALVWVSWSMRTSGITVGTASGAVNIAGLPFSILNATGGPQNALGTGVDFAVNNAAVVAAVPNTSTLLLYQERNNTTIQVTDLSTGGANNFTSGMICYRTV